jgi:hypothetical protein
MSANNDINWQSTLAAIWRPQRQYLRPVTSLDPIRLDQLIGIDTQKTRILENTRRFLSRKPANNVLLWGSRGAGKSSLVKALLNEYGHKGLRLIQVDKDDLILLPEIVDDIRDLDYRFIVFCDDISFEAGDGSYKALKSVIDGSIERAPENVLIYATSNRRHLLPESMQDNLDARLIDQEIHYGDAIEEKISLSERFGLWVGFYQTDMTEYLRIVDSYFADFRGDRKRLHAAARDFALLRGAHNGRAAQQFYRAYHENND